MALAHKQFDALDSDGNLLTNVQVSVETEGGGIVPLYSNRAGTTPMGNPVTFPDGKVDFYCIGGAYKITMTQGVYSRVLRYVPVGTAAEYDAETFQPLDADLTALSSAFTAASSSGPAQLVFAEETDNGTNKVTVKAPASLSADYTFTLPPANVTLDAFIATLLSSTTAAGAQIAIGVREKLTANRTYYVRTDGSDSNNGLANTAGGAFLTRQKAMDVIADTLDIGNYDVTVQIADGTYTGTLRLKTFIGSAGRVKIVGNTTTPANVLFSTTSTTAVATSDNGVAGVFELRGFKVQTTTSGDGISISAPRAIVYIGNIDFGVCAGTQMNASFGSLVYYIASLAVSGNAVIGFCADREATVFLSGGTIVYSNSPVYSARNFQFTGGGTLDVYSMTFTNGGTVTGKRYEGDSLGRCFTNGGGASYVPGNSAGSVANGAIYH